MEPNIQDGFELELDINIEELEQKKPPVTLRSRSRAPMIRMADAAVVAAAVVTAVAAAVVTAAASPKVFCDTPA